MTETNKQIALVTGANKGIGFETARQLAQLGFTVWLGCRDEERGVTAAKELAKDGDVRFVRLDVTDAASIQAAAARVEKESGGLDVLVNNAAISVGAENGMPSTVTVDALQRTFDANFYGVLRVTQAFLPLVKKSAAGRIVNVSSTLGSVGAVTTSDNPLLRIPAFAYAASKTALSALTGWLAVELRDTTTKVNAICPGYNATDMNGHQGTQHPREGAKIAVKAATLDASGPTGTFFDVSGPVPW